MAIDEALGTWEAASLLACHWGTPQRLASKGLIQSRELHDLNGRRIVVYSRKSCEENYRDYVRERQDGTYRGYPRSGEDQREEMLDILANTDRPVIAFADACGIAQAAKILGTWHTRVPRIVEAGKIVGRVAVSGRAGSSRLWILSEESVRSHAASVRRAESTGTKRGRPRTART